MNRSIYDSDFFLWTQDTADRLRRRDFDHIDVTALAEEIEDMGKRDRRGLRSRLAVLLVHLLKWDHQPENRSLTIQIQRNDIEQLLSEMPTLRRFLDEDLAIAYRESVLRAMQQTNLPKKRFPASCPYSLEEILSAKKITFGEEDEL